MTAEVGKEEIIMVTLGIGGDWFEGSFQVSELDHARVPYVNEAPCFQSTPTYSPVCFKSALITYNAQYHVKCRVEKCDVVLLRE